MGRTYATKAELANAERRITDLECELSDLVRSLARAPADPEPAPDAAGLIVNELRVMRDDYAKGAEASAANGLTFAAKQSTVARAVLHEAMLRAEEIAAKEPAGPREGDGEYHDPHVVRREIKQLRQERDAARSDAESIARQNDRLCDVLAAIADESQRATSEERLRWIHEKAKRVLVLFPAPQEVEGARAERDALRGALEEISFHLTCEIPCKFREATHCEHCGDTKPDLWCAGCVAREALNNSTPPPGGPETEDTGRPTGEGA